MFNTIQLRPANHMNPEHTIRTVWDGEKWSCQIAEGREVICEADSSDRTVGDIRAESAAQKAYREILAARREAERLVLS